MGFDVADGQIAGRDGAPLQWAETGVFVALALLLAGFCFWWIRRRLPG